MSYNIRLLISCPDKKGLIAAISSFIAMHDGNILSADQYVSEETTGRFFMRLEIEGMGFGLERDEFGAAFAPLARRHEMDWRLSYTDVPKKMAILVSRYDHCLTPAPGLWLFRATDYHPERVIPLGMTRKRGQTGLTWRYKSPSYNLQVST